MITKTVTTLVEQAMTRKGTVAIRDMVKGDVRFILIPTDDPDRFLSLFTLNADLRYVGPNGLMDDDIDVFEAVAFLKNLPESQIPAPLELKIGVNRPGAFTALQVLSALREGDARAICSIINPEVEPIQANFDGTELIIELSDVGAYKDADPERRKFVELVLNKTGFKIYYSRVFAQTQLRARLAQVTAA